MAKLEWRDGNQGFSSFFDEFYGYETVRTRPDFIVLEYDSNVLGPFDPTGYAWRVRVDFSDAETVEIEDGPDAGDDRYVAGTVNRIRYYDDSGNVILNISELDGSLPLLESFVIRGDVGSWFDFTLNGGNTYIGADDSMNSVDGWDGDNITTSVGDDTVQGNGGDDYITDAGGSDTYNGGGGRDQLNYSDWFWENPAGVVSGVMVDLKAGTATGPDGNVDTLIKIEQVRGTFLDDTILGNGQDNRFMGLQGDDFFNGRGGFDMIRFDRDDRQGGELGVRVNLKNGTARDGFGDTDTFTSIEAVRGTDRRDILADDDNDNYFDGRAGNDTFRLSGGNDTVRGRDGADVFDFRTNAFDHDVIEDFDDTEGDKIRIRMAESFADLAVSQDGDDTLIEIGGNSVRLLDFMAVDIDAGDFNGLSDEIL